ncbi:carbohydrate ABC transporter permease [Halovivax limisalsi]|uniref:carbohydrate ABC transporter permease n=1 Tax=Halovivax limisalsi TaxID=1453760 RepID=UPI001FFD2DE8|nr:carbohydrate ABC transporter permease [Halovivax limisalsi]
MKSPFWYLNNHYVSDRTYNVAVYASALVMAFVGLFPIYWMIQSAFKTRSAILDGVSAYPMPGTFTLENFSVVLSDAVMGYILNTVIVTSGTIALTNVVALVAGYGLARFRFPLKMTFARFLLLGYMFSPIVLALPLYMIWRNLGLLNTHFGLIVALTGISLPFSVWLMWKYIQTIPRSYEESAWIEGASRFRAFRDVVLPQTKPAIIATTLFSFAVAWNDFTIAQILLPRQEATTFAPGVLRLVRQGFEISWAEVMAVSFVMTIPPLLFAYLLQSYLLKGFQVQSL